MVFLHGTSCEKGLEIIKNRFNNTNNDTVWNCSNSKYLYCRNKDDEDTEYLTIEAALINAAFHNSQTDIIAIVSINMDEQIAKKIVEKDISCPNMDNCYQILQHDLNSYLDNYMISIRVDFYSGCYNKNLRPFYLANISDQYMDLPEFDLIEAIDFIKRNSYDHYDVFSLSKPKKIKSKIM